MKIINIGISMLWTQATPQISINQYVIQLASILGRQLSLVGEAEAEAEGWLGVDLAGPSKPL